MNYFPEAQEDLAVMSMLLGRPLFLWDFLGRL